MGVASSHSSKPCGFEKEKHPLDSDRISSVIIDLAELENIYDQTTLRTVNEFGSASVTAKRYSKKNVPLAAKCLDNPPNHLVNNQFAKDVKVS